MYFSFHQELHRKSCDYAEREFIILYLLFIHNEYFKGLVYPASTFLLFMCSYPVFCLMYLYPVRNIKYNLGDYHFDSPLTC